MSEPQGPTTPTGATATDQPPAKKKMSPWIWVLGGCLVLIVLVLLLMSGCTWFLADKAKEMAADFEANPARAAAEIAVRLNPDLELVSSDEDAGTMTLRQKSTGKEVTLNFEDIAEGRFSFETDDGESTISFDPDGDGGVTIDGPQGTTTFSATAGDDMPEWIAVYPGASEPQGTFSSTVGDQRSGAVSFRTSDPVARVLEFYERSLKAAGLDVNKTTFTAQGSDGGMLNGTSQDPTRSVTVMVSDEDGETSIAVNYSEPAG